MPNTFFGLTIGTTGLYGANLGINTTAHNITNAETEGYTRQVVNTRADSALKANGTHGMIGTGVSVYSVTQVRDNYYDEKYRSNNSISGYYEAQDYYMQSLEGYFNEIKLEGFNSNYNLFNDSLQELSKDPSNIAVRTQAESYAQNLCDYINSLDESLKQLQENTNFEIKTMSDKINSYAVQIAGLTKQINKLEVTGGVANDLRDQRNLLIDGLSNIVDVSVNEKTVGFDEVGVTEYTVRIGDAILVDTYNYNTLKVVPREEKYNQSDLDGLYELEWPGGQHFDGLHVGGRMQALYEMRDGNSEEYFHGSGVGMTGEKSITVKDTSINDVNKLHIAEEGVITINNREYTYNGFEAKKMVDIDGNESLEYTFALNEELNRDHVDSEVRIGESISFKGIVYYMQQLDEFTRTFSEKFNDLHKSGVDLDGKKGLDFFNSRNKVSGENYSFEYTADEINDDIVVSSRTGEYALADNDERKNTGSYYFMTARGFSVTKEVYNDPRKLVTGSDVTNGVNNSDLAFKYIDLKNDKDMFMQGTPQGFLQSLVAELGVDTHKSMNFNQNHKDIVSAIENQRLSVSGVDMDEEAMNLVRYQNSYNLAAKVISTMNEMYDRLINYMGV
ncbi:MAG: flagellar hook-associated protein FlgK [Lachnospiraceae bacterium]|nr:flagellar hook-associated protein FlgK [Lachnospiraceae bacterium]